MVDVATNQSAPRKPKGVGHRDRFWGRNTALRAAMETELNRLESDAIPALRDVVATDALPPREAKPRVMLMALVAMHLARNTAHRARFIRDQSNVLARKGDQYAADLGAAQHESLLREVTGDGFYAKLVLGQVLKFASYFGSMHWTLVTFDEPLLATSDHPVTLVPLLTPGRTSAPITPLPATGIIDVLEMRMALSPTHAIVGAWIDEPDDGPTRAGDDAFAAHLNRGAIAQADTQWFHHPARVPTRIVAPDLTIGGCEPLAHRLHAGYDTDQACRSVRRDKAAEIMENLIETDSIDGILTVTIGAAACVPRQPPLGR